jgi:hypothetical protein
MAKRIPIQSKAKYWETETPKVLILGKTVLKIFTTNGKVQVFPKVESAPNGVGRGSTIDLESMNKTDMDNLVKAIQYAVSKYKEVTT